MASLPHRARIAVFAGALVISAILGGTLIGAVAAASSPADPVRVTASAAGGPAAGAASTTGTAALAVAGCDAFRAAFAAKLGMSEADLTAAATSAIATTIDAAVADGRISKAAGDRLKTRAAAPEGDGCRLLAGWRGRIARAAIHVTRDATAAAATALDLTPKALREQLRAGGTLKTIAAARNVTYAMVSDAVLAAVKADLDAAVKNGTITQKRADATLARLTARLAAGQLRPAR